MATGTLAKDTVISALRRPYPTVASAKTAAKALLDAIAEAIPT